MFKVTIFVLMILISFAFAQYDSDVEDTNDANPPGEENVPNENGEAGVPGETGDANIPAESGEANVPDQNGEAGVPGETGDANIPAESGEANVPDQNGEAGVPGETGDANIPAESGEANDPDQNGEAGVPEETGDANIPAGDDEANVPDQNGEAGVPEENGQTDIWGDEEVTDVADKDEITEEPTITLANTTTTTINTTTEFVDKINYLDIDPEIEDGDCRRTRMFLKRCDTDYQRRPFRNKLKFRMSVFRINLDFARMFGSPQVNETQYCIDIKYTFDDKDLITRRLKILQFRDCAGESAVNKFNKIFAKKSNPSLMNVSFSYCRQNLCNCSVKGYVNLYILILYLTSWIVIS
ncbi:uncharacterized protein LOC109594675 isoform X2 [Aethina tumida]|uniref:uncharacterized protein LOC109594675 isoform X2 n=1 Tax=Aethina tumida TaxID=116153 RepID=UPI00214748D7|nr:uncharacterized protein LOC109594675 isoform X2 [Aethina tumida]